mmetsp:Transcript_33935/g.93897  ORF Transcript_33935/g.93897 Transcript_33935/m.93897 type:complete len:280 (-) Transcript_33935:462-1301(-)
MRWRSMTKAAIAAAASMKAAPTRKQQQRGNRPGGVNALLGCVARSDSCSAWIRLTVSCSTSSGSSAGGAALCRGVCSMSTGPRKESSESSDSVGVSRGGCSDPRDESVSGLDPSSNCSASVVRCGLCMICDSDNFCLPPQDFRWDDFITLFDSRTGFGMLCRSFLGSHLCGILHEPLARSGTGPSVALTGVRLELEDLTGGDGSCGGTSVCTHISEVGNGCCGSTSPTADAADDAVDSRGSGQSEGMSEGVGQESILDVSRKAGWDVSLSRSVLRWPAS